MRFTLFSQNRLLATGGGCRLLSAQAPGLSSLYSTRSSRSQSSPCSWQHGTTDYLWIAPSLTLHASATGRSVLTRGQRYLAQDGQASRCSLARAHVLRGRGETGQERKLLNFRSCPDRRSSRMHERNAGQERNAYKNFFTILYTGTASYHTVYIDLPVRYSCTAVSGARQSEHGARCMAIFRTAPRATRTQVARHKPARVFTCSRLQ